MCSLKFCFTEFISVLCNVKINVSANFWRRMEGEILQFPLGLGSDRC